MNGVVFLLVVQVLLLHCFTASLLYCFTGSLVHWYGSFVLELNYVRMHQSARPDGPYVRNNDTGGYLS